MLPVGSLILSVLERAVRNVPWYVDLWTDYLLSCEKHKADLIDEVFERAVTKVGFSSPQDYTSLCLIRCDIARRAYKTDNDNDSLEKVFKYCMEIQKSAYQQQVTQVTEDAERVTLYYALVLAKDVKDLAKARSIMEEVISHHAKNPAFWYNYIQMER